MFITYKNFIMMDIFILLTSCAVIVFIDTQSMKSYHTPLHSAETKTINVRCGKSLYNYLQLIPSRRDDDPQNTESGVKQDTDHRFLLLGGDTVKKSRFSCTLQNG